MVKRYNPKVDLVWTLCHKVSLVIKNSMLSVPFIKRHLLEMKKLYAFFSTSVVSQIFDGICAAEDFEALCIENVIDKQFNHVYQPAGRIQGSYEKILKTLRYLKTNRAGGAGGAGAADVLAMYNYWAKFQTLIGNGFILSFAAKANALVCKLSLNMIDTVSAHHYLREWRQQLLAMQRGYWDTVEHYFSALKSHLTWFVSANATHKVKLDNGFVWNTKQSDCKVWYNDLAKRLGVSLIDKFDSYLPRTTMVYYQRLAYILDPAEFGVYNSLDEAAKHGVEAIKRIVLVLNNKRTELGQRVGFDYDVNLVLSEYEIAVRVLYSLRNWEPHRIERRLRRFVRTSSSRSSSSRAW